MSPDNPTPSTQRRAWRFISAVGAVLAAFSLFASVHLFTELRDQRRDTIIASCQNVNERHDATITALDELIKRLRPTLTAKQRAQLPVARANDVFLFDHAFPVHKDCGAYADRLLR